MSDRLPPYRLDAECDVIAAAVRSAATLDELLAVLGPEDFYRDLHARCWRALREARDAGRAADEAGLLDALMLGGMPQPEAAEGLASIFGAAGSGSFAAEHAATVRRCAQARRLIEACDETLRECYADADADASDLIGRAESRVFAVAEREVAGATAEAWEAADEALAMAGVRERGEFTGLTTGLVELDEILDGLHGKQLVILAARPSIGKSAVAANVADHVAVDCGKSVLFMSLEMSRRELGDRLLCSRGRVDSYRFKTGQATAPPERAALARVRGELARSTFVIDDTPSRSLHQIAAAARRLRRRRGLDLLVIDYLQLIDAQPQRGEGRQEQVARIGRRLKTLAKELDIPVLALAQLNRESEKREDKRPRLSDLRESGALEQDADVVLLLHRPEFYGQPGPSELIVAKNRNGATGTIELTYHKQFTRFECYYPDAGPAGPAPQVEPF